MKWTRLPALVFVFALLATQVGPVATTKAAGDDPVWTTHGNTSSIDPSPYFLGTMDAQPLVIETAGQEAMRVNPEGKVGIGTETPWVTLHAAGLENNGGEATLIVETEGAPVQEQLLLDGNEIDSKDGLYLNNNVQGNVVLGMGGGKVGIGAGAPATKLHVFGGDPDLALEMDPQNPSTQSELQFRMDGGIRSRVYWDVEDGNTYIENEGVTALTVDGGNIGVGTLTPQQKLHVNGGDIGLYVEQANVFGVLVNSSATDGMRVNSATYNGLVVASAGQDGLMVGANRDGLNVESAGRDGVRVNSANANGLVIAAAAQDGIRVESAGGYAGYFNGDVFVKSLEINGGSDLAEPFAVANTEAIEPGMVVAIDPEQPGQLRLADAAYDRTVAGVVSGANGINPGLVMQQEGSIADGELPVALTGRVYVWADASYGAIQPGDLLTTSDTPGHAREATDYTLAQGAILGKAMSELEEGRGFVLILISLQ
jgi:hypothetical protein